MRLVQEQLRRVFTMSAVCSSVSSASRDASTCTAALTAELGVLDADDVLVCQRCLCQHCPMSCCFVGHCAVCLAGLVQYMLREASLG